MHYNVLCRACIIQLARDMHEDKTWNVAKNSFCHSSHRARVVQPKISTTHPNFLSKYSVLTLPLVIIYRRRIDVILEVVMEVMYWMTEHECDQ